MARFRILAVFLCSLFFCVSNINATAQKLFTEGVITYKIVMDPPANQEGLVQYSGTYIITLKGNKVKKELKLENGFQTTLVINYDAKTAFSLKHIAYKDVAIEMDMDKLMQRGKKYESFVLKPKDNATQNIASVKAEEGTIIYNDKSSVDIFFTKDWTLATTIFERFPNIRELPVKFTNANEDGLTIHFSLQSIEARPVENASFTIPAHAKVISYKEYEQLKGE